MATSKAFQASGDENIDALMRQMNNTFFKWSSGSLTFNFPTSAASYSYSGEPDRDFEELPTELKDAVRKAFAAFSEVANLTFNETSSNSADLRIAMADMVHDPDHAALGRGYFPQDGVKNGDLWLDVLHEWNPVKGGSDFWTLLHEVGHTLGLTHPGNGIDPALVGHVYTVMSVQPFPDAPPGVGVGAAPQTLMLGDIAALQYMYGANFNSRPLDTVYSWSPTTGETFIDGIGQGRPERNVIFMTVWDGGGTDTYDFSSYGNTRPLSIDLRPGEWTNPGLTSASPGDGPFQLADLGLGPDGFVHPPGGIANAFLFNGDTRSLIENANGGGGDDFITGNQASNVLHGNGGDDTLFYTGGVDTFFGDARGANGDTADFSLSSTAVVINPVAAFRTVIINGQPVSVSIAPGSAFADALGNRYGVTTNGGATLASLTGIENLTGSRFGDTITGDTGNNTIKAGDGNDRVFYTGGFDDLDGEGGVDTIDFSKFGSAVSVTLVSSAATSDSSSIPATGTLRSIAELSGFENVTGTAFADVINGNSGANTIDGGAGADRMSGGSGNDTYIVDNAGDRVIETLSTGGNDSVFSSVTFALDAFVENVTLTGTANINATGNDLSNTLTGNAGRNILSGGAGNDTYAFSGNFGIDTIIDVSGADKIVISGTATFEGSSRSGNDLIVTLSTGTIRIDDHFTTGTIESLQVGGKTFVLANGLIGGDLPGIISGSDGSETMDGKGGDDILYANNGNDRLLGGLGNDLLDGGNGRDVLDGGAGDDILTGGRGDDTFVFKPGSGHDTITDFSLFEDHLDISGFHNRPGISRNGSSLDLDFGGGDVLSISFDTGADHWRLPFLFEKSAGSWFDL